MNVSSVFLSAFFCVIATATAQVPDLFKAYLERPVDSATEGFASAENFKAATEALAVLAEAAKADHLQADGFTLADKDAGALYVLAEASDMQPGEPVEFFVTTTNSGYNYESIAVAYAAPSLIHRGLEFVGCKKGWTVNYSRLRFWPRGDLVSIDVMAAGRPAARIETLASDEITTNAVERTDFVFVGSDIVPKPGETNKTVYAADAISPQSIASNFNLIETVLDLPQQRSKSTVYGQHFYGKAKPLRPRQPIVLVFRRNKEQPSQRFDLDVQGATMADLAFTLKGDDGVNQIKSGKGFTDLLATFDRLTSDGVAPHVDMSFGESVQSGTLQKLGMIFKQINTPKGIRIGPPPAGQLYFETFSPNADFRDRMKRPTQPFELHLKDGGAELIDITENWIKGKLDPELTIKTHKVASPDKLLALVKASSNVRDTLFIYASPETTHGEIMNYVKPVRDVFKVYFVYTDEK